MHLVRPSWRFSAGCFQLLMVGKPVEVMSLLCYYCATTVLLLCYYCATVLLLCYRCATTVLLCYCATTVLLLCYYCATTVLLLCYYCTTTVLLLCYYCVTTVLLLCYYSATTVQLLCVLLLCWHLCCYCTATVLCRAATVLLLCYYCATTVLLLCYYGATTVLLGWKLVSAPNWHHTSPSEVPMYLVRPSWRFSDSCFQLLMVGKKSRSYQVSQESHLEYLSTNSPNALSGRISGIPDMTCIFFQPSEVEKNYQKTFRKV
jgi:hypothetical protein